MPKGNKKSGKKREDRAPPPGGGGSGPNPPAPYVPPVVSPQGGGGGPSQMAYRPAPGTGADVGVPEFRITADMTDKSTEEVKKAETSYISKFGYKKPMGAVLKAVTTVQSLRPTFGGKVNGSGTAVELFANYFPVTLDGRSSVWVYTVAAHAIEKQMVGAVEQEVSASGKDPRGKKLRKVLEQVLEEHVPPGSGYATNFKDHVVTPTPLAALMGQGKVVTLPAEWGGHGDFRVTFNDPKEFSLDDVLAYLQTMKLPKGSNEFTHFQEVIDALGVVFSHAPLLSSTDTLSTGRGCFFPLDNPSMRQQLSKSARSLLEVGRGFFQSARLATRRLLLNVNVTYAIFRTPGNLAALLHDRGLAKMDAVEGMTPARRSEYADELERLNRRLGRARVVYTPPTFGAGAGAGAGADKKLYRTLHGFAKTAQGEMATKGGDAPPRFSGRFAFAAPQDIFFRMEQPPSSSALAQARVGDSYIQMQKYFETRYTCNLDPRLPAVYAGNDVYLPAEFCEIEPGDLFKASLEADESDVMIKFSSRRPNDNASWITTQGRAALQLDNPTAVARLSRFGITVGKHLVTVPGRLLAQPSIKYQNKVCEVKDGRWNITGAQFPKPAKTAQKWTHAYFRFKGGQDKRAELRDAVDMFGTVLMSMQVNVDNGAASRMARNGIPVDLDKARLWDFAALRRSITDALGQEPVLRSAVEARKNFLKKKGPAVQPPIVMFILPAEATRAERDTIYEAIKVTGDISIGLHSICMQESKLRVKDTSTFNNVALKFNLKAGNVNHIMTQGVRLIKDGRTMVVGYDVTHPTGMPSSSAAAAAAETGTSTSTSKGKGKGKQTTDKEQNDDTEPPSHGAMVANVDSSLAQWPASIWNGPSRQEMYSDDLTVAIQERLDAWFAAKNQAPENILIYRDGLSEGQFAAAVDMELAAIRAGIEQKRKELQAKGSSFSKPKITFIVSVKRHQTRFYLKKDGKVDNPVPGTVVDRSVTVARHWDFYLQAHKAIQGTARPTHYTVLHDEIFVTKFGEEAADRLQEITYHMSCLFGRSTTSVSLCPPAYYADIVCSRARVHMRELYQQGGDAKLTEAQRRAVLSRVVHANLSDTMYYI